MTEKQETDRKVKLEPILRKAPENDREAIVRSVEVLRRILIVYGLDPKTKVSEKTIKHWVDLCDGVKWYKVVKYKLVAYFNTQLMKPLPACPFTKKDKPGNLLGGKCDRYVKFFKRAKGEDLTLGLLYSLLQSKGGMPQVSESDISEAEKESFESLTGPVPEPNLSDEIVFQDGPDWGDQDFIKVDPKLGVMGECKVQLRRTVRELLGNTQYTAKDAGKMFFPSTSANYNNTRSKLGSLGMILTEGPTVEPSTLVKALLSVSAPLAEKVAPTKLRVPGGGLRKEDHEEEGIGISPEGGELIPDELYAHHEDALRVFWKDAMKEKPLVKMVGLPEPLKIRTISKGPWKTYYVLKNLQKKLHNILRNHPTFQLVGTPVTSQIVQRVLGLKGRHPDRVFLSGDYKSATDKIFSWASDTVAEEIGEVWKLTRDEVELMKRALTGHILEHEGVEKEQTRGQLMGSIISFPILCIINAALCRKAYEDSLGETSLLKQVPMLINGDDVVMKGNTRLYPLWSAWTREVGLIESPGKTYVSADWLTINSQMFKYSVEPTGDPRDDVVYVGRRGGLVNRATVKDGDRLLPGVPYEEVPTTRVGGSYYMIGYVNASLLFGKQEGLEKALPGTGIFDTLGSRAAKLVEMTGREIHFQAKVLDHFIDQNRYYLESIQPVPWFVPEAWGGVGLPVIKEEGKGGVVLRGPSTLDLQIMAAMKTEAAKTGSVSCIPKRVVTMKSVMRIREVARKKLDLKYDLVLKPTEGELDKQISLDRLLVMDLVYDSNVRISDLAPGLEEPELGEEGPTRVKGEEMQLGVDFTSQLNKNMKLWSPKRWEGKIASRTKKSSIEMVKDPPPTQIARVHVPFGSRDRFWRSSDFEGKLSPPQRGCEFLLD
jgi:hypothetical protein